ncbi:hypothetical protein [Metaclostridioides mangenotii]|uniref:hypothetical protein n=1 Tax=Metaclostridioides mangenotii TaxID=1540 RepID=UPI0028E374C9|nr:hypothetical protein [Clostridioides mangenotii]
MKKIINYLLAFLQFVLIVYCIAVQYFTETRMGMVRHVMFKNREWATNYPLESLLKFFSITLVLSIIFSFLLVVKKRAKISSFSLIVFSSLSLYFLYAFSVESYTSYYFTILGLIAIILVQVLMVLINISEKNI